MKKVSIMVPCYNEEENVVPMSEALVAEFAKLPAYDYEILFIDNCSKDSTRAKLREICAGNPKIKAIFNTRNFGQFNSPYYGITQTTGDCTICVCCDFQDPVELIPTFLEKWEEGSKIVVGVKTSSKENKLMYGMRSLYYKIFRKASSAEMIEHFTGFGLYDASFVKVLRDLDDPTPFIRGIVGELGPEVATVEYEQPKRRAGKTSNNFFSLYDAAMLSFTSYTRIGPRAATFLGIILAAVNFVAALTLGILYCCLWQVRWLFSVLIPVLAILCMGGVILFFVGFIGEYLVGINRRLMKRPLVIEEERINF